MKKNILIILLSLFSINAIKGQEKTKDTLFFKLDKYLYQSKSNPKLYIIKDNYDSSEGANYFEEFKIINISKPKKILCFKKYAKASNMYFANKRKLNDFDIMNLTSTHVVVLVNKKNKKTEYIEVSTAFVIE